VGWDLLKGFEPFADNSGFHIEDRLQATRQGKCPWHKPGWGSRGTGHGLTSGCILKGDPLDFLVYWVYGMKGGLRKGPKFWPQQLEIKLLS
jgi:hypothetical protein